MACKWGKVWTTLLSPLGAVNQQLSNLRLRNLERAVNFPRSLLLTGPFEKASLVKFLNLLIPVHAIQLGSAD